MKKLIVCAIILGIFVSCSKTELTTEGVKSDLKQNFSQTRPVDMNNLGAKLRSEIKSSPIEDQTAYFLALNSYQQYYLWKDKLTAVMAVPHWNPEQRSLLNELYGMLSIELFTKHSNTQASFINDFVPGWYISARSAFGKDVLATICGSLDEVDLPNTINRPGQKSLCACQSSADFCPADVDCKGGGCGSDSGCGILWLQDCNGLCRPYI